MECYNIEELCANGEPIMYVFHWANGVDETIPKEFLTEKHYKAIEELRRYRTMIGWVDSPKKKERLVCEYCGVIADKEYGTCAHCGAPLRKEKRYV